MIILLENECSLSGGDIQRLWDTQTLSELDSLKCSY